MIFTEISCENRNIQELWLDGKIVWQYSRELFMYGDMHATVKASATFRLAVHEYLAGNSEHTVKNDANITLAYIELAAGDTEIKTDAPGAADLIKALMMATKEVEITTAEGAARLIKVNRADVYGHIIRLKESGSVIDIKALLTNSMETDSIEADGTVEIVKALQSAGKYKMQNTATATGWALYIIDVNGSEKEKHGTDAYIRVLIPGKSSSIVKLKTGENVTGRVFPADRITGDGMLYTDGNGYGRLSDVIDIAGRMLLISHSAGSAAVNDAQLSAGYAQEKGLNKGYINKQRAITSDGMAREVIEAGADVVLWWLPVGDGEPLEDGSEIQQRNGKVLEIQQAFQVIEHKDRGVLEVI